MTLIEIKSDNKSFLIRRNFDYYEGITISCKNGIEIEYYKMYIKYDGLCLENSLRDHFEIIGVDVFEWC